MMLSTARLRGNGVLLCAMGIVAILLLAAQACAEWQVFTASSGLASNGVQAAYADRNGRLWFAATYGLSCYDGATWKTYTRKDGLAGTYVESILEDRQGNMWFGSEGGVARYDGTTWTTYKSTYDECRYETGGMYEDRDGSIWFWHGDRGCVSKFDGAAWTEITEVGGETFWEAFGVLRDRSGDLWISTSSGVFRYDGQSWAAVPGPSGSTFYSDGGMLEDRAGRIWVGWWGGASVYDGQAWTTYTHSDGMGVGYVKSLFEDRGGNIWVVREYYGVSRFDGERWTAFDADDCAAIQEPQMLTQDRAGNIWIADLAGGAIRFDGSTWRSYSIDTGGEPVNEVRSMLEDTRGNLWFGGTLWGGWPGCGENYYGVTRYDGTAWERFCNDSLGITYVNDIAEDRHGNIWLATAIGGAIKFDGEQWTSYTTADGLGSDRVNAVMEDRSGSMWFGTDHGGVSRFDGETWKTYRRDDGLGGDSTYETDVYSILEDRGGNMWFGIGYAGSQGLGVTRFDGENWRTYTTQDGLVNNRVSCMLEDRAGRIWFGTSQGVSCYQGGEWTSYTAGLGPRAIIRDMAEDADGNIWFAVYDWGAVRFDGENWRTYDVSDGLIYPGLTAVLMDHSGRMWFGTPSGVTVYEPDRIPPLTVLLTGPPPVASSRLIEISYAAAYGEASAEFSYQFDDGPWSLWAPGGRFSASGVADGPHSLRVRARDRNYNVEPEPVFCAFEVDATPPLPVITSPSFGDVVRGSAAITGSATDGRFARYILRYRQAGATSWDPPAGGVIAESTSPVGDGVLGVWDTAGLVDGTYDLGLTVTDTLGLTGVVVATVIVDNEAPWAGETSPALISSAAGGDVYTTDGELHLYVPPRAFAQDAVVTVAAAPDSVVPLTLPGATRLLPGFAISWAGAALGKSIALEMQLPASVDTSGGGALSLYFRAGGGGWKRLGGTADDGRDVISATIAEEGVYALYLDSGISAYGEALSGVSLTPRVFSPTGGFGTDEAAISFTLGHTGSVTVKIYNRAGRLAREVASGQQMNAGANLVRWDGRDQHNQIVEDGLYLITVEAHGHRQTQTLAVVK